MKVEIFKKRHEHHTMRPTRQIALSFLAVILIGTILLSLPICNKSTPTTFLNNLFYVHWSFAYMYESDKSLRQV